MKHRKNHEILSRIARQFPGNSDNAIALQKRLTKVCTDFVESGLADRNFVRKLTSDNNHAEEAEEYQKDQNFWSCLSEALIADRLKDKKFARRDRIGVGPDFLILNGNQRVWIEVICPNPRQEIYEHRNRYKSVRTEPHNERLLRWTHAISEKTEKLMGSADGKKKGYLSSGLVCADDAYVIAINGCQLRSSSLSALKGISQYPLALEAVLSLGPYGYAIDRHTLNVVDEGHQYRPHVINKNQAEVPTTSFLNPKFSPISAIWAVDLNGISSYGGDEPTALVHNPNATNPIPFGFLPSDEEYFADISGCEIQIRTIEPVNKCIHTDSYTSDGQETEE